MNPRAFTNMNALQNVNGAVMPGTFNRMVNTDLGMTGINPYTGTGINQPVQTPQYPPTGVQTDITPDYEINNV